MQVRVQVQVTSVRVGELQVPVLGEYPPVAIGRGWVPAYRSTKVHPRDVVYGVSRRMGGWGRGEGGQHEEGKEEDRMSKARGRRAAGVIPTST